MITVKRLTLEDAKVLLDAAEAKAHEINVARDHLRLRRRRAIRSRCTG